MNRGVRHSRRWKKTGNSGTIFAVLFLAALCLAVAGFPATSVASASAASSPGTDQVYQPAATEDPLTVMTTQGLVHGKVEKNTLAFLGIPYAQPPVGPLRFAPPVAHASWTNIRETTEFGAMCPQPGILGGSVDGQEDCLTLNVWTPIEPVTDETPDTSSEPGRRLRPVMFFIHGGANFIGTSGQEIIGFKLYSGRALAQMQETVVVTANYRLGALGFMAHPAFAQENDHDSAGNYGLLDLILALEWVQDNIAAFGGDPSQVLVFGESAGAFNTCSLLVSPLSAGLFSAALMESGTCELPSAADEQARAQAVARDLDCDAAEDTAACLRAVSVDALVKTASLKALSIIDILKAGAVDFSKPFAMPWGANVDGWVIPDSPLAMLERGDYNRVPFALGSNRDEAQLFLLLDLAKQPYTCRQARNFVREALGDIGDDALEHYSCCIFNPKKLISDIATDAVFTCPTRRAARAAAGHAPVYRYYFQYVNKLSPIAWLGAFHASEIPFVFAQIAENPLSPPVERRLSRAIGGYWAGMAQGDPNIGADVPWPLYDADDDNVLVLDAAISTRNGIRTDACDFWDSLRE